MATGTGFSSIMNTPVSYTGLEFLDTEDEIQRIEVQALTNEDDQLTVKFLLEETRHAYQIINQRQTDVEALQAEIDRLRKDSISAPAPIPAALSQSRVADGKKLSDVVDKFVFWKDHITNGMSEDDGEVQIDTEILLEDIEDLESAHANYQSSVDSIVTGLQNAQSDSTKTIARLNSQIKAVNERATAAEKVAGHSAITSVQKVGAISIENAKLRAEVAALKSSGHNFDLMKVNPGYDNNTHSISDHNPKGVLDSAKYAETAPALESNLGQMTTVLGQHQSENLTDGQSCNCGCSCDIDFREYIKLFDESVESAIYLADRIAALEELVQDGSDISPKRLDSVIRLTKEVDRLQRQLNEATSELSNFKSTFTHGIPHYQSARDFASTEITPALARITDLEAQNATLEEALENAMNKISDLETERLFIDDDGVYDNNNEIWTLHEEIESLEEQVASLKHGSGNDIIQKLDQELSVCKKEKEKAITESLLMQQSLQHLQGEFDAVQAEVIRLQDIINGLRQNQNSFADSDEIARLTAALTEYQKQRSKDALEIAQADRLLEESIQRQEATLPNLENGLRHVSHANLESTTFNNDLMGALGNSSDVDIAAISAKANRVLGLEEKINDYEKTIASLQARISGDRNAVHQIEIDALNGRVKELTDFLDETEEALANLQEEHAEQTVAIEALAEKIEDLQAQRDRAEDDLARELRRGGDNVAELEVRVNDLQQQLNQCDAERKEAIAETGSARLKQQVKDLTAQRDDLQEELDSVGKDPEQITTVKWRRGKRTDLRNELEDIKRNLRERDNALSNSQAKVKKLEIALSKAEETAERIRGERTKARKERDDARKRLEKSETGSGSPADLKALRAEVAKYKKAASASDRAQGAAEIGREKLRKNLDKALAERDAARQERDQGRNQAPASIQKLMSRVAELEKELELSTESQQEAEDQFAEEKSILRNKIQQVETTLTNTQKLLDSSRQTKRDAEDENIRQIDQLKLQLKDERDSTQQLQDELIAAQTDGDQPPADRSAVLARQLKSSDTRLRAREQLIADMDTRLSSAIASNNVEAAELRRQLAVAQADIARLKLDPTSDQEEVALLRQENDELSDKIQDLKDAKRRLRNEQAETERLRNSVKDILLKIEEGRCCEKAREAAGWKVAGNAANEYIESERESRLATIAALEDDLKESHRVIANLSITLERNMRDSERQASEKLTDLATARGQITALTTQLENLSPETDAHLWQKLNDCNIELEAKEKLIQEQRDEFAELQLKVEHAETEVLKLRDEISYWEKAKADLEKQLSDRLQGKKKKTPQSSSTTKTEIEKDEEIQELKEKLARKDVQLKNKKRTNRNPRGRFADDGDDDELEETMVENEKLRERHEKERKALVTRNRTLREQLKAAEQKVAEMNTFIDEDLQNEPGLGDDFSLRSLIATLKEHNKRLQKDLDGWKSNDLLKDRQRQIANLELEIQDLHYKLASTENKQDALDDQKQSLQLSTEERNGYIMDIEMWQQRVGELEAEVEELKGEVANLREENTRLSEDLKAKRDILDRVMNTVDNFKEEVQAIEEEEVDPDLPYEDKASEASVEVVNEDVKASRDTLLLVPVEDQRQSRERSRQPSAGSSRIRSAQKSADEKPTATRGKRGSRRAETILSKPESSARRSGRKVRGIPEETEEFEKPASRSSKRKTTTTETSQKETKASAKKRKLK